MTRFQLRRLALQATRRPELLPVLQDALLESREYASAFERAIEDAHDYAERARGPKWAYPRGAIVVVFNPVSSRRITTPFTVFHFARRDFDWTWPDSTARHVARQGRPIVYVVPLEAQ